MRIVLINPKSGSDRILGRYKTTMEPFPPLGIASIAAVLERDGHEVAVIDQYAENLSACETIDRIAEEKPGIIGISCLTPAMPAVFELSSLIRRKLPDTKIVLGNIHASAFHEYLLQKKVADFVVHGEGENAISALAQAIESNGGSDTVRGISFVKNEKVVHSGPVTQVEALDSLPYPAWHLLPVHLYKTHPLLGVSGIILPVQAIRGCPYNCAFCAQNAVFKHVRIRCIDNVIDEIEYLVDRFNIRLIGLADSIFPLNRDMGFEFAEKMVQRGLHKKIQWFTESRVNLVDFELLKAMKEAGLHMILYGIESGNRDVLRKNRKQIKLEDTRRAIEMTKKADLLNVGLYVLGLPGETAQSCLDTIRFAVELDTDFAKFNLAIPYPGSRFFNEWWDGEEELEYHKFSSWYLPRKDEELLYVPEGMTQAELLKYQQLAMAAFWLRPSKIYRHLQQRTITLNTMWKGFQAMILNLARVFAKK